MKRFAYGGCTLEDKYIDSILGNKKKELDSTEYFDFRELSYETIENGIVLPLKKGGNSLPSLFGAGGVVDAHGKYVENSAQLGFNMMNRVYGAYEFNKNDLNISSQKVVYINYFIKHWGHFLLDVIGRLWFALENISDYYYVYTVSYGENDYITGNFLEFIKFVGIPENRLIMINKPTRFESVIVPESAIYPGKYYTEKYKRIFDKVISGVDNIGNCPSKIYCSRSAFCPAVKKESGEAEIEKIFTDNGFVSIHMETLTLSEQIDVINSADEIVALSGTLAHNLLFSRNKNKFTILNKTYLWNSHQYMINKIAAANVIEVDIYVAPLPVTYGNGPFIVKITNNLIAYCKDNKIAIGLSANTKLNIREKIKYYLLWIWTNKRFVLKHGFKFDKFDMDVNYTELKEHYKLQQK